MRVTIITKRTELEREEYVFETKWFSTIELNVYYKYKKYKYNKGFPNKHLVRDKEGGCIFNTETGQTECCSFYIDEDKLREVYLKYKTNIILELGDIK